MRLPFAPIESYVRSLHPSDQQPTIAQIAEAVSGPFRNLDQAQIHRWRKIGVDCIQADVLATALGMVPYDPSLWGSTWEMCADEMCGEYAEVE